MTLVRERLAEMPNASANGSSLEGPRVMLLMAGLLLGEVLFMVVTGVLCGMNGFADIEEFYNEDLEWFKK